MGVDVQTVKFLLSAKDCGMSLRRTLMIGRQELCISPATLCRTLRRFGMQASREQVHEIFQADGYADGLFRLLGAETVDALDASPFEGASLVHDLNDPIPARLVGAFDCVCDGGSLEHVFNVPVAMGNCMQMVREGGHFIGISPANGYGGHGLYQFSPELFFRVFSEQNGFELVRVVVFRPGGGRWYEVVDPADLGRRLILPKGHPILVAVCARKTRRVPIFSTWPQQSDYAAKWSRHESGAAVRKSRAYKRSAWQRVLRKLKKLFRPRWEPHASG